MKNFFLISTEHLEDALWFRDDDDFTVGMNYVAIEAFIHNGVFILAFILMSNHVHFVLYGEKEDAVRFVNDLKRRYSHYYQLKYGIKQLLNENDLDVELIPLEGENLERALAYVLMNCVVAGICLHPSQYPWGSGNVYFKPVKSQGSCLSDYSKRSLRKILHSAESLPGNWIIGDRSFILPDNYVKTASVEQRFRSPQRMDYFIRNSSKAKKRLSSEYNLPAFTDQTIFKALPELLRSLFQKNSFSELTRDEQTECLRQIRYRFSADLTQAARACGITYSEAANLIDKV